MDGGRHSGSPVVLNVVLPDTLLDALQETLEETRAIIGRVMKRWVEVGYSWWAPLERETEEFVGAGAVQNLRREATLAGLGEPSSSISEVRIGFGVRRQLLE